MLDGPNPDANPSAFVQFRDSLSPQETAAIDGWLGFGAEAFRAFELCGDVPSNHTAESMAELVKAFGSAMGKAVVCRADVFRGMSAGEWRPERMAYLTSLVEGPDIFTLRTFASTSTSLAIGKGFCYLDEVDEERNLAVLLRVRPVTARFLRPFVHDFLDEEEVVLLKGTSYLRTGVRRMPDPKAGLKLWEVDVEETTLA